ncbi:MAG: biopolymer transporter ExbD [Polyangiaceae bacterium]|nr:biopolymer transporter ExbD [Polyangiaceae bacterium]
MKEPLPPSSSSSAPGPSPSGAPRAHKPQASVVRFKAALRKARQRNQKEPDIDFLNITAMLDLMTIILVFVLKSLSASTTNITQNEDLQLPVSIMTAEPGEDGVVIRISKTQITVADQTDPVVSYADVKQLGQTGVDARHKRNGPNDLYIQPLANVLSEYRKNDKRIREAMGKDASTSDAIIIADESTPYRLLFEVLYTAGQSEFGRYHLLLRTSTDKSG